MLKVKQLLGKYLDYTQIAKLAKIKNDLFGYWTKSYGQTGLDLLILSALRDTGVNDSDGLIEKGFYIDVGAHHPERYSNTYILYNKYNWHGINIDPIPGIMKKFNTVRSRDTNLEMAIVPKNQIDDSLIFHVFNDYALNTFSKEIASERNNSKDFSIIKEITVKTNTLENICIEHKVKSIDYLNIDAEGYDFKILTTLNFNQYKPKVISIELYDFNPNSSFDSEGYSFLIDKGYKLYASIGSSLVFTLGRV
jgi:FkbM family methyltransferase